MHRTITRDGKAEEMNRITRTLLPPKEVMSKEGDKLEETELAKVKADGYKLCFLWICVVVRSFPHTEHPTVK
ncbi:hypothetical protein Tco_1389135 [Tanacetum coccineum]